MHETGIVRSLVRCLQEAAAEDGATRVAGVRVRLGALSPFSASHFRAHFNEEAEGTLAAGAAVEIEKSEDVLDPHAHDVLIVEMTLDVPDKDG